MSDEIYERISRHPKFAEMVAKRNRFAIFLSAVIVVVYLGFVLLASLWPATFAAPIAEGWVWPIGITVGWSVLLFSFLMTGIYVIRANSEFDDLNRNILEDSVK